MEECEDLRYIALDVCTEDCYPTNCIAQDVFETTSITDQTSVKFETLFKETVESLILELKTGLQANHGSYSVSLVDSLILSIKDGEQKVVVSQDKLDFDCLIEATKSSYIYNETSKNQCTQSDTIVEFATIEDEPTEERRRLE